MISLIVAVDKNFLIGKNNALPWGKIPADMKHFREKTLRKTIVMGRKTFESIGKPLPDRNNIVLTRDKAFEHAGITIAHSISEILKMAETEEIIVIGGALIYKDFLPHADRIYMTEIEGEFDGDTYFPSLNFSMWSKTQEKTQEPDEKNTYHLNFITLARKI